MFANARRPTVSALVWPRAVDARFLPLAVAKGARYSARSSSPSARRGELDTIKSSREIDSIFRESTKAAHPLLMVLVTPTPARHGARGRVAVIAGRRLGSAVLRNRCRRVLRESIRRCRGPWPGWDVAVVARAQTAAGKPEDVDRVLRDLLERAGVP
jgi:ribonuclease P protein component